jgi:hypothetical protein
MMGAFASTAGLLFSVSAIRAVAAKVWLGGSSESTVVPRVQEQKGVEEAVYRPNRYVFVPRAVSRCYDMLMLRGTLKIVVTGSVGAFVAVTVLRRDGEVSVLATSNHIGREMARILYGSKVVGDIRHRCFTICLLFASAVEKNLQRIDTISMAIQTTTILQILHFCVRSAMRLLME